MGVIYGILTPPHKNKKEMKNMENIQSLEKAVK